MINLTNLKPKLIKKSVLLNSVRHLSTIRHPSSVIHHPSSLIQRSATQHEAVLMTSSLSFKRHISISSIYLSFHNNNNDQDFNKRYHTLLYLSSYNPSSIIHRSFSTAPPPLSQSAVKKPLFVSSRPSFSPSGILLSITTTVQKTKDSYQNLKMSFRNRKLQFISNPRIIVPWSQYAWRATKDGLHHLWVGSKLLVIETKVAWQLLKRVLDGKELKRKERLLLIRTGQDLFRLIPFSVFVIVPFMEFLLPVALKLWPNMLPSTFEDKLKKEENLQKTFKARVEMAEFLQDMVTDCANQIKALKSSSNETILAAENIENFMTKLANGVNVNEDEIKNYAKLFNDEFSLDNISMSELEATCRYMGVSLFGGDTLLRFKLKHQLAKLRRDDRHIFFEGVYSLEKEELEDACRQRGMRCHNETIESMQRNLSQWLDFSMNKNVPPSLLIISRAFMLAPNRRVDALREAMSEVVIESAEAKSELQLQAVTGDTSDIGKEKKLELYRLESKRLQEVSKVEKLAVKEEKKEGKDLPSSGATESGGGGGGSNATTDRLNILKDTSNSLNSDIAIKLSSTSSFEESTEKLSSSKPSSTPSTTSSSSSIITTTLKEDLHQLRQSLIEPPFTHHFTSPTHHISRQYDIAKSLIVFAAHSTLEKERRILTKLKEKESKLISAVEESDGGSGELIKIKPMLNLLNSEIQRVDSSIGRYMKVLEKDNESTFHLFELEEALRLLRVDDQDEGQDLLLILKSFDKNNDGKISLQELFTVVSTMDGEHGKNVSASTIHHPSSTSPSPPSDIKP